MAKLVILLLITLLFLAAYKPYELREFSSISELETFLQKDNTNEIINPLWDCDDYAINLQNNALKAGKLLNVQILGSSKSLHMVNLAIIGNKIVFIEPTEDRIFEYGVLDIENVLLRGEVSVAR